jgi:hypothetical protein
MMIRFSRLPVYAVGLCLGGAGLGGAGAALVAEPAELRLRVGERVSFLITEKGADGFERDVTEVVAVKMGGAGVAGLDGVGAVRAGQVGEGVMEVELGGERLAVPVVVGPAAERVPTFAGDVLPVLGKAGCSAAACHARADGQNGFRLSVFSFDPKSDYHQIVRGARGRRVFPSDPGESLLLLKASGVVPHEGGERLAKDSDGWRVLRDWIGTGMVYAGEREPMLERLEVIPAERRYRKGSVQRLLVRAHYGDGTVRDVTALSGFYSNDKQVATVSDDGRVAVEQVSGQAVVVARYMGLVGGAQVVVPAERELGAERYEGLVVRNFIDRLAYGRFRALGLLPSGECSDGEFLRRASLDVLGILPTAEEARQFLADGDPEKRRKVVARLLEHPAYADHWAAKFADLFRPNPDRVGVKGVFILDQWLRESFRRNQRWDEFVREMVLAQGNTHRYGPAVVYRDRREPAELTTMFSQLFLGVRLDCAKCHHHPNEKWSQEDFYRMAAFFAPLRQKGGGISAPISGGHETFYVAAGGGVLKHPVTGEQMMPQPPDGPAAVVGEGQDPREALVAWMLDPGNPFFAKAIANRVWSHFFGKGIVDPVDDFRLSNPATHPELLEALAEHLRAEKYDLKALMRTIMESELYQLSSEPNETNAGDVRSFSRYYRRRMGAEMMADAVSDVTGVPSEYPGLPGGGRAVQAWTYKIESRTMDAFGRPNSSSDCPCERNMKPAISQALHLMNAEGLQGKLTSTAEGATVQRLASGGMTPREIVDELYLICYGRLPVEEEAAVAVGQFGEGAEARRRAVEDVLWALINSAEFVFNH